MNYRKPFPVVDGPNQAAANPQYLVDALRGMSSFGGAPENEMASVGRTGTGFTPGAPQQIGPTAASGMQSLLGGMPQGGAQQQIGPSASAGMQTLLGGMPQGGAPSVGGAMAQPIKPAAPGPVMQVGSATQPDDSSNILRQQILRAILAHQCGGVLK